MSVLLALSAGLVSGAVVIGREGFVGIAMLLVLLAIVGGLWGLVASPARARFGAGQRILAFVLGAILLTHVAAQLFHAPTPAEDAQTSIPFIALWAPAALLAVLLLPAMFFPHVAWRRLQAVAFVALICVHLGITAWLVKAIPFTVMDVFIIHDEAARELLRGGNPYAMTFTDLSAGTTPHFDPSVLRDGRLQFGYPYLPFSLILNTAAYLLAGDVRFTGGFCVAIAGLLIFLAARRSAWAAPACAAMMFTPRVFEVIGNSWVEPCILLALGAVLSSAIALRRTAPIAVGLLLVSKQTSVLLAPLALLLVAPPWTSRKLRRWTITAVVSACVMTVPFVLLGPQRFWFSTVEFQLLRQPFRADSLSFAAIWARWTGVVPPTLAISLLAVAAVQIVVLRRAPRTPAAFAGAVGICLLAFYSLSRQAFVYYYVLAASSLLAAVAVSRVQDDHRA